MMKKSVSILTISMILLTFLSCNVDNEGIFLRVSQSEPIVDVGSVTLIALNGTTLFAHTGSAGMQSYNTATGDWSALSLENTSPILASLLGTDGTDIFAGETSETNNTVYSFAMATPGTVTSNSDYDVISMGLHGDIMAVDTGTQFDVRALTAPSVTVTDGSYLKSEWASINIMAQDNTTYLVSLRDTASLYSSYLYYGGTRYAVTADLETPVRAFFVDSTGRGVFVLSNGAIYYSADVTSAPAGLTAYSVSLKSTNNIFRSYPLITNGDALYIQVLDNGIYSIDMASGATAEAAGDIETTLNTVDILSYVSDGSVHYAGTIEHGIIPVTFN